MSTQLRGERLAALPRFREAVTIRPAGLTERLAEMARRDAFLALFVNAPRKPEAIYELQRSGCRTQLPGERQRRLIHDGIRAGYITREQVIQYRASQLQDDLAAFGGTIEPDEAVYVAFMTETAEAVDAATKAKGLPTRENVERCIAETREAIAVAEIKVATLSRGVAS